MADFDVVIVGARCAGAPLAMMLARAGVRVCVLDKAHFPSETPSTHIIQPSGVQRLADLGVLPAVMAAGAVPLDRFTLVNDDVRIDATSPEPAVCVRRVTLDALLVDAAARAGATVRTGCRVTGLIRDDDGRVCGVETARGPVSGQLVVGADGCHSLVAAQTGAAEYLTTPAGRSFAWAYFDDVADLEGRLRLGRQGEYGFLAGPTDGGMYMAAVATDLAQDDGLRADRDRHFRDGLARWPELADLLAGATRVGPIRVVTNWHGYFRHSAGPGWVLVGDAGHFKDPTPGQGISDALRQAETLAEAISSGLAGSESLDASLRRWWRWRDRDAYGMYWFAHDMGAPGASSPLVTAVLRGIAADPAAIQKLLDVLNHDLSPARLLTPGRMMKAAAGALRDRPDLIRATLNEIAAQVRAEVYRTRHRRAAPNVGP